MSVDVSIRGLCAVLGGTQILHEVDLQVAAVVQHEQDGQEQQFAVFGFDSVSHLLALVHAQAVEDDNLPRPQVPAQHLADVSVKGKPVYSTLYGHRSRNAFIQ
jgi:hypothetical protein